MHFKTRLLKILKQLTNQLCLSLTCLIFLVAMPCSAQDVLFNISEIGPGRITRASLTEQLFGKEALQCSPTQKRNMQTLLEQVSSNTIPGTIYEQYAKESTLYLTGGCGLVEINIDKGLKLLEQASQSDDVFGKYLKFHLALYKLHFSQSKEDSLIALALIRPIASGSNLDIKAPANYLLCKLYEPPSNEFLVPMNIKEAVNHCMIAAHLEYKPAMFHMALRYQFGSVVTKDLDKAYQLYSKTSYLVSDYYRAELQASKLGDQQYKKTWDTLRSSAITLLESFLAAPESEVVKEFKSEWNAAHFRLGFLYKKTAPSKAEPLLLYAADAGILQSYDVLGDLYASDISPTQPQKAMHWYQRAYRSGSAKAAERIGGLYLFGKGVERSYSEAEKWYRKSYSMGNKKGAIFRLNALFNGGYYTPTERTLAEQYNAATLYKIGLSFSKKGQEDEMLYYLNLGLTRKDANNKQYSNLRKSSLETLLAKYNKDRNQKMVLDTMHKIAEYGDPKNQLDYGIALLQAGKRGISWIDKASAQNYPDADYALAVFFEGGQFVNRSLYTAGYHAKKAINNGHTKAKALHGRICKAIVKENVSLDSWGEKNIGCPKLKVAQVKNHKTDAQALGELIGTILKVSASSDKPQSAPSSNSNNQKCVNEAQSRISFCRISYDKSFESGQVYNINVRCDGGSAASSCKMKLEWFVSTGVLTDYQAYCDIKDPDHWSEDREVVLRDICGP